jgi:hypothetical protein
LTPLKVTSFATDSIGKAFFAEVICFTRNAPPYHISRVAGWLRVASDSGGCEPDILEKNDGPQLNQDSAEVYGHLTSSADISYIEKLDPQTRRRHAAAQAQPGGLI